jgi:hypothetical protein
MNDSQAGLSKGSSGKGCSTGRSFSAGTAVSDVISATIPTRRAFPQGTTAHCPASRAMSAGMR